MYDALEVEDERGKARDLDGDFDLFVEIGQEALPLSILAGPCKLCGRLNIISPELFVQPLGQLLWDLEPYCAGMEKLTWQGHVPSASRLAISVTQQATRAN